MKPVVEKAPSLVVRLRCRACGADSGDEVAGGREFTGLAHYPAGRWQRLGKNGWFHLHGYESRHRARMLPIKESASDNVVPSDPSPPQHAR